MLNHCHALKLRERLLEIRQLQAVWPVVLVGCAQDFEDFEYLVNLTVAHEKRSSLTHLCENASCRPEVDTEGVRLLTKKNFRASVPESDDFMRIRLDRKPKGSCQTEVSKLALSSRAVNEQILRLQISVENTMLVKIDEGLKNLVEETLSLLLWKW